MSRPALLLAIAVAILPAACANPPDKEILDYTESPLQARSMQTRVFATGDRQAVLRAIVATLQDFNFLVEAADSTLGTVTARRAEVSGMQLDVSYAMRVTASVRPRGEQQTLVRMNAEFNRREVTDPKVYQQFFSALGRSLFLDARSDE